MRIIAGDMRSRKLKAPEGMDTRPTADRVKEALFSILQGRLYGARVLDLYAGSGALALEALSHGAESAVLARKAPCWRTVPPRPARLSAKTWKPWAAEIGPSCCA